MDLLKISSLKEGIFLKRINKFLGIVKLNGYEKEIHIHDPGRLSELLFPTNKILIKEEDKPHRKTKFDLIAAFKNNHWVLVHSGYHRKIAEKIIQKGIIKEFKKYNKIHGEVKYNNSRIDFKLTNKQNELWLEVKGCTLTKNGIALFPDAPTKRGTRHLKELIELGNSAILILIFRKDSKCFMPNFDTDPEFAKNFKKLLEKKVKIYPVLLSFKNETVYFEKILPLCEDINEI